MDNKTYISQLSELKVMSDLASKDYHIFCQIGGKAPFDIIAYKDGKTIRISVKSISTDIKKSGKYVAELRRVRSNTKTTAVYKIEKNDFDIMAIYIAKEDKIVYLKIDTVIGRSSINIEPNINQL